jgi:predicted dehydrogenase
MWSPQVERSEALTQELAYFSDCIAQGKAPHNDGAAGLQVVKMLEAATQSIKNQGALVRL